MFNYGRAARAAVLLSSAVLSVSPASAQTKSTSGAWSQLAPSEAGLSEEKLRAMSAAVRSDAFKKIGSILIARHGKLVYEDYIDGDASTLRDTRSATKSIMS